MTQPAAPPFHSPFAHDFVRLGVCTPAVRPADPAFNAAAILAQVREADAEGASLRSFRSWGSAPMPSTTCTTRPFCSTRWRRRWPISPGTVPA